MLGQYLITFREILEAGLIIGIILAYLQRVGQIDLKKHIWQGVGLSVISGVLLALIISLVYGGLSETAMEMFEGVSALIAVAVLTTMIVWMARKGRNIKEEIENKIDKVTTKGTVLGLITFSFIVVFREILETILFLTPFAAQDISGTLIGSVIGAISALVIVYLIFKTGMEIDLRKFFYFSSILLIFVASGLAGYGVHELIEVYEPSGWLGMTAYEIGLSESHILHDEGIIGSVFSVMFGYSTSMEWLRVIVQFGYLMLSLPLVVLIYKMPEKLAECRNSICRKLKRTRKKS